MKMLIGFQKGINLGGWLSQCRYEKEHYETFITEEDIRTIASWNLDHIRLPIDYEVIAGVEDAEAPGLIYVDRCTNWCRKYGLNLILDLHKVPGYAFYAGNENCLFGNTEMEDRFIRIWTALAKRYGQQSDHIAFELLNEIVEQDSSRWNSLAERTIQAVRKEAKESKILIGGIQWNSAKTLKYLDQPDDENVVFNFHFYEPFLFTHQGAGWVDNMPKETRRYPGQLKDYQETARKLGMYGSGLFEEGITQLGTNYLERLILEAVEVAKKYNTYLYCGEYGVISNAPGESISTWFAQMNEVFEKYGIGRAAWTYKSKSFGISDEYAPDITQEIIPNL